MYAVEIKEGVKKGNAQDWFDERYTHIISHEIRLDNSGSHRNVSPANARNTGYDFTSTRREGAAKCEQKDYDFPYPAVETLESVDVKF